ncbi:MAG: DUF1588 domain-containing protein [Myxococcales bacterium]|nr:DUF1588 domain-containing protein [Myxococcales bacterium]
MAVPMRSGWALLAGAMACACSERPKVEEPPPPVDEPLACEAVPAAPLRLLTRYEYDRTVQDLLGDTSAPAREFPREPLAHGLDNDATLLQVAPDNVARYFEAAEFLSRQVMTAADPLVLPSCEGKPASCGREVLAGLAPRVFRRPLRPEEWELLVGLHDTTHAAEGPSVALERGLQLLLQSPQFLYRDELGAAVPNMDYHRLSGHQLATKLSYFLRATTPDATLMAQAASGVLGTSEGIGSAVGDILAQPDGLDGLARFLALWLSLDEVATTEKDMAVYPEFSLGLAASWRQSLALYIADVLATAPTLKALLTSRVLFADKSMALYLPKGTEGAASSFAQTEVPQGQPGGVLAQPGFLAFKALHDGSSPIRRGTFVLDKLLCEPVGSPPANVPITPPAPSNAKTTRERFEDHKADATCALCHKFIDPVGFVFENFDGMGRWRLEENGIPIDARGGILAAADESLVGPVEGPDELIAKLAQSRQVHDCVAREVYRFAVGRPLARADECWFEPIRTRFFDSGGDFKALLAAIATSPGFRTHAVQGDLP